MVVARSLRRNNSVTWVVAGLVTIVLIFFLLSPSAPSPSLTAHRRQQDAAEHSLSPPTKPFLKKSGRGSSSGKRTPPPVVRYNLNELNSTASPAAAGEHVLILTPMARFYREYWDNLLKLTYPHELISLGFILPKTKEGNAATAALQAAVAETQSGPVDNRFASVTILRQDFDSPLESQDEKERHKYENQKIRRQAMSRARNSLLFTTLGPATSWVLWLDADIVETPPTLIEDLARHDKPVIVPNCFQRYYNSSTKRMERRPYDFNSWQDSATAQELAKQMGRDEILLEGYAELPTYRTLLAYMAADEDSGADPHLEVQLDGVGGTALMVKAQVHRDGAMFPAFPFYHLVETEGFAKMARRLGYTCWGLPNYFVRFFFSIPLYSVYF